MNWTVVKMAVHSLVCSCVLNANKYGWGGSWRSDISEVCYSLEGVIMCSTSNGRGNGGVATGNIFIIIVIVIITIIIHVITFMQGIYSYIT